MTPCSVSPNAAEPVSPLTLSHHLLFLAEQAHRAGMARSAGTLLRLAQNIGSEFAPAR